MSLNCSPRRYHLLHRGRAAAIPATVPAPSPPPTPSGRPRRARPDGRGCAPGPRPVRARVDHGDRSGTGRTGRAAAVPSPRSTPGRDRGRRHEEGKRAGDDQAPARHGAAPGTDDRRKKPSERAAALRTRRSSCSGPPFLWRVPAPDHRIELAPVGEGRMGLVHVSPERFRIGVAPEGRTAGEALVHHAAQRVAVRASVHLVASDLLRRRGSRGFRGRRRCPSTAGRRPAS